MAPMHMSKRHLSLHRRARLIAWALAMLTWMTSLMFAGAPFTQRHERQRGRRMSIAGLTHMVKQLIIVRAADLARQKRMTRRFLHRGRDLTPRALIRAVIGARVRRMLKRKDAGERIAVLTHALKHIDTYAALVAKRLRGRLTRLWPRLTARALAPASSRPQHAPIAARFAPLDSS